MSVHDDRGDIERRGPSLALRRIRTHAVVPERLLDRRPVPEVPRRDEIIAARVVKRCAERDAGLGNELDDVRHGPRPRRRMPDVEVVEHPLLPAIREHSYFLSRAASTE